MRSRTGLLRTGDTIFNLATAPGKAGVAMVRISGPGAREALQTLTRKSTPLPRKVAIRSLYCPQHGSKIDHQTLCLYFDGPKSYTGEDVVEFHCHGNPVVVQGVFQALHRLNLREAEAGEFTQRAFHNAKMDLTEIEGLSDLYAADTEYQRQQALVQLGGNQRRLYEDWRQQLVTCMAHFEALVDFADDAVDSSIPSDIMETSVLPKVEHLMDCITQHLNDGNRGEIIRQGVRLCIAGPPNAGKSSLLNTLAKKNVAIVSNVAGTTRDVIETTLNVDGMPLVVSDTAGIHEHVQDAIEKEGILRAHSRLQEADVCLLVFDVTTASLTHDIQSLLDAIQGDKKHTLLLLNKSDLISKEQLYRIQASVESSFAQQVSSILNTSCNGTPSSLAPVIESLSFTAKQILWDVDHDRENTVLITRERHRHHLEACLISLTNFHTGDLDLVAQSEELRIATDELGRITGLVDIEEVLDVLFRDFCIGK